MAGWPPDSQGLRDSKRLLVHSLTGLHGCRCSSGEQAGRRGSPAGPPGADAVGSFARRRGASSPLPPLETARQGSYWLFIPPSDPPRQCPVACWVCSPKASNRQSIPLGAAAPAQNQQIHTVGRPAVSSRPRNLPPVVRRRNIKSPGPDCSQEPHHTPQALANSLRSRRPGNRPRNTVRRAFLPPACVGQLPKIPVFRCYSSRTCRCYSPIVWHSDSAYLPSFPAAARHPNHLGYDFRSPPDLFAAMASA